MTHLPGRSPGTLDALKHPVSRPDSQLNRPSFAHLHRCHPRMAARRQSLALWGSLLRAAPRRGVGAVDIDIWAVKAHACCFNDMGRGEHGTETPPAPAPAPAADGLDWRVEAEYQRRVGPLTGVNYDQVQQAGTCLRGSTAQASGEGPVAGGCPARCHSRDPADRSSHLTHRAGVHCHGQRAERRNADDAGGTATAGARRQRQRLTRDFQRLHRF